MTIPILTDRNVAEATILRRVPLDEKPIPQSLKDSIAERFGEPLTPAQAVDRIIHEVREGGDEALRRWTKTLDRVDLRQIEIPQERLAEAAAHVQQKDPELHTAIEMVATELEAFHRHQHRNSWVEHSVEGARGQLIIPLQRVGIYVPGGAAPLPSSLLHAAIPARVAGVEEIVACAPPHGEQAEPSEVTLAAAHIAGVKHFYALGGVQAIAAMAYGTESVVPVDKIVGPGNLFVVLAKRAVFGRTGIESLPGPTETLVVADEHANARYVAADLLAQAEHVLASAILVTPSQKLAEEVQAEVMRQVAELPEPNAQDAAESVSERGGILVVSTLEEAFEVANNYGPEHLCLLIEDPWTMVGKVRNAGGIFLGEHSFEVLGDYTAGPSHIMPTEGSARYSSPVNVDDFRKVISLVGANQHALNRIGPPAMKLAEAEGLFAHAAAVRIRLTKNQQE